MIDLNDLDLRDLYTELARDGGVTRLLDLARDEDLGPRPETGDITSRSCVPGDLRGVAKMVARKAGVISGLAVLPELLHVFKADADATLRASDGDRVEAGEVVAEIEGSLRAILSVERTALNLVGRMSGIATATRAFVDEIAKVERAGGPARLLDTRKTTPGLRVLEKYAVRCGGGRCHRIGLYDAVLIKDNHLAVMNLVGTGHGGGVGEVGGVGGADGASPLVAHVTHAIRRALSEADELRFVEVEVDSLGQLQELLDSGLCRGGSAGMGAGGVDIVLLDNMTPAELAKAVAMRDAAVAARTAGRVLLEASGGVTLATVGAIAASGVDHISTGAVTHSAAGLDVALDMD